MAALPLKAFSGKVESAFWVRRCGQVNEAFPGSVDSDSACKARAEFLVETRPAVPALCGIRVT
jgi:hypothetical protein